MFEVLVALRRVASSRLQTCVLRWNCFRVFLQS